MRITTPYESLAPWPSRAARWLFNRQHRLPRDSDGIVTAFRDGEVTLRQNRRTEGFTNALAEHGYQGVRKGDLVIHSMDAFAGAVGVSDSDGKASPVVHCYRPSAEIDPRFYAYLLRDAARSEFITSLAKGIRERSTAFDSQAFQSLMLPVPEFKEQRVIADFLDAETARIDALIERKRRLASLLQDRWIEYVRETITQGAHFSDPLSVTQKEIDWDIARAVKLPRFLFFGSGTTPPSADESMYGGEIPWILTGDLNDGRLCKTSRTVTQKALREVGPLVVHPSESLVIAMYGATIGKLAILDIPACVNQACSVLTPRGEDSVEFVFYWLLAHRQQLIERGYGAGQPNISQESLKAIRIALPPVEVQNAIIHRLSQSRAKIFKATQKLDQQIELLTEHRQALITAAVTGQLEVPNTYGNLVTAEGARGIHDR